MYFVIAGGGEVGFHLAKALLEAGHETMVIESDRRRAQFIEENLGSVVLNAPADEGRFQVEAGCQRADAVIAVTGEDPANLVICQLAKWKCNVPRVIARVNDPKNEIVFKALGIDETISSMPSALNTISFFGSFTRAMTRGTLHFHLANWQMTRFAGSSPVTAMTASARWQPASTWKRPSSAGALSTTDPRCSSMNCARRRSLSMSMISCPASRSAFARWNPTSPPPAMTKY